MSTYEYDSIVIGGGAAGLTASGISVNLGAKTMMIEADKLGGDCTWTGCIPSKTILKAGKIVRQLRNAGTYGLINQEPEINFRKVMQHVDKIRNEVYEDADRPEIFEEMGIEVVHGRASFLDSHTLQIDFKDGTKRKVTSRYFFIATGAKPMVPAIPGLETVNFLTNHNLFDLNEQPKDLMIIGAGPIGIEMAQTFNDLGSSVTVMDMASGILTNDDRETVGILHEELKKQGIVFELNATIKEVRKRGESIEVFLQKGEERTTIKGDALLIATGRTPNIADLNLEVASIDYSKKGIHVNSSCRTNRSHIYAIGDVSGKYQLTHMSEHMAKIATTKALLKFPMKMDVKHVSWVTYTSPEVAHLGAKEIDLKSDKINYETYRFPYTKIDRAVAEGEGVGLIKIFAKKLTGKILGVSIVGEHAGELISEYAVAMRNGVTLRKLADTIHPYPSWGLGARRAADQWYIKNQSENTVKWIKRFFRYRGETPDYSDPDRIV